MADERPDPDELPERSVADERRQKQADLARSAGLRSHLPSFAAAALASALATLIAFWLFGRDQLPDVVMLYLLAIMLVAGRFGLLASVFAAFVGVAAFDFFFIPPYLTFDVTDFRHTVTFVTMFLVAVVISTLTQRVRNQAVSARQREERTHALYELSRELAAAQGIERVIAIGCFHLERVSKSRAAVFTRTANAALERVYASPGAGEPTERELGIAQWVWSNQKEAGLGTNALPGGDVLYLPLTASGGIVGVLGLSPGEHERLEGTEQRRNLDAFLAQIALAMERAELAEETDRARREMEREQLRSSLLSSVSHDLRTPLAVITGAASTLVETPALVDDRTRGELLKTILEEAERLNRLIGNLLDMTRLESGAITVHKEWVPLEEVVGSALNRLASRLGGRDVRVELPGDLPLVPFDAVLVEQTLINLLENAVRYGADPLEIRAVARDGEVLVEVCDRGPGIPQGEAARIFDKFHRAAREGGPSGVGLGLAICRAIVAAHGGTIWAQNRDGGGASFRFTLPVPGDPPAVEPPPRDDAPEAPLAEAAEGATKGAA